MTTPVDPLGKSAASKMVRALLAIEWHQNGGGTFTCPGCGGWTFGRVHDRKDCKVDGALKAAGYATMEQRDAARRRIDEQDDKDWRRSWGFA